MTSANHLDVSPQQLLTTMLCGVVPAFGVQFQRICLTIVIAAGQERPGHLWEELWKRKQVCDSGSFSCGSLTKL